MELDSELLYTYIPSNNTAITPAIPVAHSGTAPALLDSESPTVASSSANLDPYCDVDCKRRGQLENDCSSLSVLGSINDVRS